MRHSWKKRAEPIAGDTRTWGGSEDGRYGIEFDIATALRLSYALRECSRYLGPNNGHLPLPSGYIGIELGAFEDRPR